MEKTGCAVAVMNAKGGVGKSTVTLLLAEFLCVVHNKKVLLVDADPQSSLSLMVLTADRWQSLVATKKTIADAFGFWEHQGIQLDFASYIQRDVSNIATDGRLTLLPGSIDLSYLERHMAGRGSNYVDGIAKDLLAFAKKNYDVVLIDCQPSVTLLSELWLRISDYHLLPCRCDFPSSNGIAIVDKVLAGLAADESVSDNISARLGVVLNMKSRRHNGLGTKYEQKWEKNIRETCLGDCFRSVIQADSNIGSLNSLPDEEEDEHGQLGIAKPKTFAMKYPSDVRKEIEAVVEEFLAALDRKENRPAALRREAIWRPPVKERN